MFHFAPAEDRVTRPQCILSPLRTPHFRNLYFKPAKYSVYTVRHSTSFQAHKHESCLTILIPFFPSLLGTV